MLSSTVVREMLSLHPYLRAAGQTGRSGLFHCQIVDTETECDGLMSYDRMIPKVDPAKVAAAIRAGRPKLLLLAF